MSNQEVIRSLRQTNGRCIGPLAHILIVLLICAAVLPLQMDSASAAAKPGTVTLTAIKMSGTSMTVKWKAAANCTGYQIQYADNRLFFGKSSVKVNSAAVTSKKIKGISATDMYYVRIRSFLTSDGKTTYSAWTLSGDVMKTKTITRTPIYKNNLLKSKLELRRAAKQKVPGYDTVQGSCYGKGYAYFVLENRNIATSKPRCKIVKVKLSSRKVVRVSGALKLSHGNDMTFDTKRNRIVVAHSTPVPKRVSVVNPNSLKITSSYTVELPDTIKGISTKTLKRYKKGTYTGFGAIAYNAKHDRYVVVLRGKTFHHLMILNRKFVPERFIWLDRSSGEMMKQMLQSADSYDDFIMVGQSYGYGYSGNSILIYNWDGDYLSKLNLGTTYEMESIFHAKGNFYCSYYTSYYKYNVLKNKYVLQRDNFIYQLTNL